MLPRIGARLLPLLPHRRHFSLARAAANTSTSTSTHRSSSSSGRRSGPFLHHHQQQQATATMSTSSSSSAHNNSYETLQVEKRPAMHTAVVRLNRPQKRNAMNARFWRECRAAFEALGEDGDVRVIVLCGAGKVFSSGLDLGDIGIDLVGGGSGGEGGGEGMDAARKGLRIKRHVTMMQEAFNAIERAPQPVVSAIHGACIGGAIDMVAACDVRLASAETVFAIKEVDIGLAADLGTLTRVPRITGNDSLLRELCYTGRNFTAAEAQALGLLSRVLPTPDAALAAAEALAAEIASKSPVAVVGTKVNLNYARDHSTKDALDYITTWNAGMLQTQDVERSVVAAMSKGKAEFSKL